MEIVIAEKGLEEATLIQPLWEQLNARHLEISVHFKDKYRRFTFEERMETLQRKAQRGKVRIFAAYSGETVAGYCIVSIVERQGCLESICVRRDCRGLGIGGRLMEKALAWFEKEGISDITIDVVYDNHEALPFYQRYGFYVSTYILKRRT